MDRAPPLLRKATSKIPSVKEKFHLLIEKQVIQHRLYQKLLPLFHIAKSGKQFSRKDKTDYERIEETMQRIIKSADNKCRKARRGPVPFSQYQKKLMGSILILQQIKLRFLLKGKANRPRTKRIHRLIKNIIMTTQ
jgi:hypothetical protein